MQKRKPLVAGVIDRRIFLEMASTELGLVTFLFFFVFPFLALHLLSPHSRFIDSPGGLFTLSHQVRRILPSCGPWNRVRLTFDNECPIPTWRRTLDFRLTAISAHSSMTPRSPSCVSVLPCIRKMDAPLRISWKLRTAASIKTRRQPRCFRKLRYLNN